MVGSDCFGSGWRKHQSRRNHGLRVGGVELLVENGARDERETLMKLSLLWNSAARLGIDLTTVFARLQHLGLEAILTLMRN